MYGYDDASHSQVTILYIKRKSKVPLHSVFFWIFFFHLIFQNILFIINDIAMYLALNIAQILRPIGDEPALKGPRKKYYFEGVT